jgi:signal transduction histidine kinase/DNA-binding response OmpR family regulator
LRYNFHVLPASHFASKKPASGIRPSVEAVFVGFIVFITAMAGIAFLASEALSIQKESLRDDLLRMARAASGLVDGDLHEKLADPSQAGGAGYLQALEPLVQFHRGVPEIAYLYTLIEKDGRFHFVLDTATAADRLGFSRKMEASGLMEPYKSNSPDEDREEMDALRQGTPFVSKKPFSDEYGTFLTALAPVTASDGRTVAVVGLDLNVTDYVHRLGDIRQAIAFACAFVFMASVLVGVLVFRFRRRLRKQEAAGRRVHSEKVAVEDQNRRLVSALGQIVYHYDARTKRMEWRGECEAILGFPPGEMPEGPNSWEHRIHPEDIAGRGSWTKAGDSRETSLIREYRFLHSDGHPVWVLDRAVLTSDARGKPAFVDGVMLDISARKAVEDDLIAARDIAEAAGRAKTDFLAVMSHEIRTPMNGVIGCSNLLLETPLNPQQREYLDTICKCGDSLLHLISDILDFSKMESDKLVLEERPFSLRNCVEEVLDLYGLMASEKKIELLARFEDRDLDWICGDEVRFRQILVNLVSNALKFTTGGEVVVTLGRKPWPPGGDALMLSVKDTGIGIPKDKQEGIFLPFSQADSSTTRKFGGTGLGLAICGRLAALMGGTITVNSEGQKGSEFVVLAPLAELRERNPRVDAGLIRGKSLLLVDDNSSFRMMIRDWLGAFGIKISTAEDIPSLKACWEAGGPPDVLLVDTGLPSAVLEEIALLSSSGGVSRPRVVGLAMPSLVRDGELRGLTLQGSLTKPVRAAALFQLLGSLFSATPSAPEPQPGGLPDAPLAAKFPLKILVAEDNEINRRVVLQILKRLGYTPSVAGNGRQCLERLESESYDIILMDIQMPEMDGYEATAALRRRGDTTWITALTADAMPEDPMRCRIAGMNDYLSKPIRAETLRAALVRCAVGRKKDPGL